MPSLKVEGITNPVLSDIPDTASHDLLEITLTPQSLGLQLQEALAEHAGKNGKVADRDVALAIFRRHLGRYQTDVRQRFEKRELRGVQAGKALAAFTDELVSSLVVFASNALGGGEALLDQISIAATGGYGKKLLAPFSDIDLLFLTPEEPSQDVLSLVEYVLYFLWDLGLKVGHATRSITDCIAQAEADTTVRTALLDARLLVGSFSLFAMFEARFIVACVEAGSARFITDKRAERAERHRRFGESPYLVEPNIKEGRGGLRDMQTLYWMCRYTFGTRHVSDLLAPEFTRLGFITEQEAARARRSWDFLWTVRFHLHYVAGRGEDRLTFDMQPVLGGRMGYTRHGRQNGVERFMRHYFLTVREVMRLTHILEPTIMRIALGAAAHVLKADDAMREAGFTLLDGQILPAKGVSFDDEPIKMFEILELSRSRHVPIHPLARQQLIRWERRAATLRSDPRASEIFLELLCDERPTTKPRRPAPSRTDVRTAEAPHPVEIDNGRRLDYVHWLRILNESGLWGALIPDWSRIVGQMQFDTYHIFTVDEHTIEALRILRCVETGTMADEIPVAYDLARDIQSRRALYMSVMMHDIAKGRGGDHSELGSELALELCPRLGMSSEETETVSWLVLQHLLLSHTAFQRDIDDPKTILDVADVVQSPERLRLLLLLTIVDMRAVSPRVWNAWKATLLRELYTRVAEVLEGGLATPERDMRVAHSKAIIAENLEEEGFNQADINHFLDLGYAGYWLCFDQDTLLRHARLIREAESRSAPFVIETQPLPARGVTEVTIHTQDHPGLFAQIAGAMALAGASIVDARIHTLSNGMALDTLWIQDATGEAFDEPHRLTKLFSITERALSGRLDIATEIAKTNASGQLLSRTRAIHVPPRVVIDNRASNSHTVIEINGRDRPGLLHDVASALNEMRLQIYSAHITTYGVRAVDVFYVKDLSGMKVTDENRLKKIRDRLMAGLKKVEASLNSGFHEPELTADEPE
ncbi:PII uridylyl-transferase [Acetobacter aceti NRIC 0242]|uniref:Bifunctional uridylyltransferase/uridylyl-removing enzyme n=1 Tax=Acetobacter aceti NBRC 14818 TaxID=887700 RepID=A0AB33IAH9_ACEAC|nr:[protein-PII] uridylyltransferase [Acetobacter aceti]TCS32872.1 [protein-PII] uridylyltransferase [Acetobacter aceti NBRC 14818]BCK74714.1 bifunctional uridylyltransferase/uridylyl-removing enzyme [Acetobacter aceti NBRC 14818]GAN58349.1 PII uridylyl-transferase [Acetobacter aceti NBRC 14818]GBO80955.1 PII uridylyl-transferase [Acetobacter aceti NRIC 0242]